MKYNGYNIYIHNGVNFDLNFLFKHIVELKKELKFKISIIRKDDELLNITIKHNKTKNTIQIKDSYKLLLMSLSKLCKNFGVEEGKGIFPFDFAGPNNFNYTGDIPDYKYYAFNGKSLLSKDDYNKLVKSYSRSWSFMSELKAYNIQDCVALYNILIKFDKLIREKFNFNFHSNPTLSSLAFSIYRNHYIPSHLIYTERVKKGNKFITNTLSHIDNLNQTFDSFIRNSYFGGHVDSYIPYFNVSQNNTNQVLYHYDVVSLYPYVMKSFKLPYKIKQFVEGNILLSNKELFDNSFGFYKVKVTTPKQILNPLLPFKNNGAGVASSTVLYPEGSWIGTYYSEEIKNAIKYGYKFEIISGYLFEADYLFRDYIGELFNMKLNSQKGTPMYLISKLLMNSLYGKFGIHFELPNYTVIEYDESKTSGDRALVGLTDLINLNNGYALASKAGDTTQPLGNVAISSAITALARVHMSQFFNNYNHQVYYTDTDSIITDKPLSESLVGKNLGQMTLENTYTKFITLGPKFYGGITSNGHTILKIKGLTKDYLPTFSDLVTLLEKGKELKVGQLKSFKNLSLSEITLVNLPYLLRATDNKRDFVYLGNKIWATKNKIINIVD